MARRIQNKERRASALRDLATALARAGEAQAEGVFCEASEVARGIQDEQSRASALCDLAAALAQVGYFAEAFARLGKRESAEFIREVAKWNKLFDTLRPSLSVHILQEVLRIIGWERPDWLAVHSLLATGERG